MHNLMLLFPGAHEPIYNENEWAYEEIDEEDDVSEEMHTQFPDINGDSASLRTLPQPDLNMSQPLSIDLQSVSIKYCVLNFVIYVTKLLLVFQMFIPL